jgi:hypothetical protein
MPKTKEEFLNKMKEVSAKIGMYEIKRNTGEYVSMNLIQKLKREFGVLSRMYRSKFYKLI